MSELLDRAGRRRSPATMPEFHAGRPRGNKGVRYPADPPKVEEIVAVMRAAGDGPHGRRPVSSWVSGPRPPLVQRRFTLRPCQNRAGGRPAPSLRAASASRRRCRRDGPRRRAVDRHPTTTRAQHLGITSIYLQGIDNGEIIDTVHSRHAPMVPVSASLRL
jgi:hypothetical protein